jgi:hypothetical protein
VALVWITERYRTFVSGGVLFEIGEPMALEWYARGRRATRDEIMHSIETGLPALREMAERQGPDAVAALQKHLACGIALVPS